MRLDSTRCARLAGQPRAGEFAHLGGPGLTRLANSSRDGRFRYSTDATAPRSNSGLFVPTSPTRVIDARPTRCDPFADRCMPRAGVLDVEIAGVGDVPASGVGAVLANPTGTDAIARGHATLHPSGTDRPLAADLNLLFPGAARPDAVVVPLGGPGDISIFGLSGMHTITDVFGYFPE